MGRLHFLAPSEGNKKKVMPPQSHIIDLFLPFLVPLQLFPPFFSCSPFFLPFSYSLFSFKGGTRRARRVAKHLNLKIALLEHRLLETDKKEKVSKNSKKRRIMNRRRRRRTKEKEQKKKKKKKKKQKI